MTKEINEYYKDGYSLQYDVPLNKLMVNWDIKDFLTEFVGITYWDDLVEANKKICFRDYPKKSLPDFNEIVQESW